MEEEEKEKTTGLDSHMTSLLEELEQVNKVKDIPTLCRSLDALLDGGIKVGTLTQVVGLPGVGKTCFSLQLCLNVQIPKCLQGPEGKALYIGTNHSISGTRLRQMGTEFVKRCNNIITKSFTKQPGLTIQGVLNNVNVIEVCTLQELSSIVFSLESFLEKEKDVRLVVIDGIDFPFFTESESFKSRVKVLYTLVQVLYFCISKYKLSVVITNCMTTRFGDQGGEYFFPYLGDAWNYAPNQILKFTCDPNETKRRVELVKSHLVEEGVAHYRIIHEGFRD